MVFGRPAATALPLGAGDTKPPFLKLLRRCTQVTANHYFTDALAGAAVVGVAYFAAMRTPEFGRGATADWGPALHWLTGAISVPSSRVASAVT